LQYEAEIQTLERTHQRTKKSHVHRNRDHRNTLRALKVSAAYIHLTAVLLGAVIVYVSQGHNNKCTKERIMMGSQAYYANRQMVNSSLISRNSKLQIYHTLVCPVVTYGSESWTLTM
jgi:uncharacterized protein HemX